MGWYSVDGEQLCGLKFFAILRRSMGVPGVIALEILLIHAISNEIQRFLKFYRDMIKNYALVLEQIRDDLFPEWKSPENNVDIYTAALKKVSKLMAPFMTFFSRIGQMQLLRRQLKNELQLGSRIEALKLSNVVATRNNLFLVDLIENEGAPNPLKCMDSRKISDLLISTGKAEPMQSIFMKNEPLEGLPLLITLFVIKVASDLDYDSDFGALVSSNEENPFDGWTLVAGIATLLRQFHSSYAKITFALLSQYATYSVGQFRKEQDWKKSNTPCQAPVTKAVKNTLIFMRQLNKMGSWNDSLLFEQMPASLMELYGL